VSRIGTSRTPYRNIADAQVRNIADGTSEHRGRESELTI